MANGIIASNQKLTCKKYTITPTANNTVSYVTGNIFQSWVNETVDIDVAKYGDIVAVSAIGYGGIPTIAAFDYNGTNWKVRALQWGNNTDDITIYVTYALGIAIP